MYPSQERFKWIPPTVREDMDRSKKKEDKNPDCLHVESAAVNSSDFFLRLQLSGQWKRCLSLGAPLLMLILALPLDKEGEEIHRLPFLT